MSNSKRPKRAKANATGRNNGEPFIGLFRHMTRSPAWRRLSPNAKALLLQVWERHNGANNGQISYSVREAEEEIGMKKNTAARALQECVDKGFLKVRRQSSFNLKTKEAREWEITAERCDGRVASKDFMRWSPDAGVTKVEK